MSRAATTDADQTIASLSRRLGLSFALRYALIAGALFAIYGFPYELLGVREDWLAGYLAAYAQLAGAVLRCFESGLLVDGNVIHGRFPMQIVRNCDAADVNILFVSAVVAFPSTWRSKLLPLLGGMLALVLANVLRICSLYYFGIRSKDWFTVAHEEVWPLLLVVLTTCLFLVCSRHMKQPPEARPDGR
jgi:exosortase/archaeosortase family protein